MRYVLRFLAICGATALGVTVFAFALVPQVSDLVRANRSEASFLNLDRLRERSLLYDSSGNLIGPLPAVENRSQVTLDQVPSLVKRTILAVEDENFYIHKGVNVRATLRALSADVQSGAVEQGGSTITMQLVKNSLPPGERDLKRKTQEAFLAWRLEDSMTKDEILERYLNTVYFGNGAYGVQAAAETYFGKNIGQLDWPDAALLAAMISSPRDYDPFVNPKLAIEQRHIALQRLVDTRDLTQAEADLYAFTPLPTQPSQVAAPPKDYFLEEVKQRLLDDPSYNLGDDYTSRYNAVFSGGLRIYTTLDPAQQLKAIAARNDTLPTAGTDEVDSASGLFVIRGTSQDVDSACPRLNDGDGHCLGTIAMVSVDPSSGAVRSLVGGPGFENWKYDLVTQATRQPGSSMKAFVLATALEQGITVDDTISGSSCSIKNPGGTPDPYTQKGEGGTASLVKQTAGSVNCAFLRLGQIVGIDKVIDQARKMGITAPLANVVSFPLGVNPISPLEMAGAYAAIDNDGVYNQPYFIDKITDAAGKVIYEHSADPQRVMSEQSARQETVALQAVVTGGTATRARLSDRPAAGKTGTTDKHGDAWFIGFTPQLTTAVWMGSPESVVPMNDVGGINVFGGTFPALVWHNFMEQAMDGLPVEGFTAPDKTRPSKYLDPKDKEVKRSGSGSGSGSGSTRTGSGPTNPTTTTAATDTTTPTTEPPATTEPPPTTAAGGGGP
ncbi:MAG TPA: transglycosylase domain-containing protein [Acidimicrobiales bacterium]|nr:transglycosylase domain-containing protein [Acidimicrobiales bacterium]